MYLPREIVEKTFREGGQGSRPRLLGRGWHDLRTREELEEELQRPIELEDILFYSRKTGKDFVIYGVGLPYNIQKLSKEDVLDISWTEYSFYGGYFVLTGNTTEDTFVELYRYVESVDRGKSDVVLKKTSPMTELQEVFDNLFYPLERIDRSYLTGVAYETGEVFQFEDSYSNAGEDPLVQQIIDDAYYNGVYPSHAWSEGKEIVVEGMTRIDLYQTDLFHGYSSKREPVYLDREVAEYILNGRVAYSIPVERKANKYLLWREDEKEFVKVLALRDDPRPEFSRHTLRPKGM